jgi:3-phenylpropionate/trans-cinnamate dioxygenase ferredoxin reductase component
MANREVDFLVVGGGVAGWNCVRELREGGERGSILLVSREPDPPYDRTACSKAYLQGRKRRDDVLLAPEGWWEENEVELLTRTSVLKLAPDRHRAALTTKDVVEFGSALIATGAQIRRLRVEGSQLDGIHYLRALGNSDAIRRDVEAVDDVVLVGGSYIGTEVAASLAAIGKRCTIVMQEDVVLERGFGRRVGGYVQSVLEEHGVTVHGGDELAGFEGTDDGRVSRVLTRRGLELDAGAVVIGAGVLPDVALARSAGLALGESGGILTDARMETSAKGIFAAGDVCDFASEIHPAGRLRVEHWEVAAAQGRRAAAAMRGAELPEEEVPYFFSDLHDWLSFEYIGPALRWDREVVRGSMEGGSFSVWYLDAGRVAGVLAVDRPGDLDHGRRLLVAGTEVDPERLADQAAELAVA